ncbi:GAF domain-containing protein [filamentous cyanobacterium CCP1]|nr:GAF domain-containing protein [filamentous cyanobacterium CCP2]PSB68274.1 GAF domain-containing protein [filamentous cyanobacterium CCP1]
MSFSSLESIFSTYTEPEALFNALLPEICQTLQTDRCFLVVRHPDSRMYRNFCWRSSPDFPDLTTAGWEQEQEWEQDDPMFAAALRTESSIFVEDIETAPATVLNREFERENFGHRALVHAHLCHTERLWGILQPCIFNHPRSWSEADRHLINHLIAALTPIVVQYVQSAAV